MKGVLIVEDDLDIQSMIQAIFAMDPRFSVAGLADSVEEALELARTTDPAVIVLDDRLNGELRGIDGVPQIKDLAPRAKIIMFSAHTDIEARVVREGAIDAFLLKTHTAQLLPTAQQLTSLLSLV